MTAFLIRRAFTMVLVALVVSVLVFALARAQGDPRYMYLSEHMTQEQWDELGVYLGLDRPVLVQYFSWLGNALRGDLGTSLRESRPVWDSISERIPATFQLAVAAWTFSVVVGWPLGVLSAVKRGSMMDYAGRGFALFGQAIPGFWLAIVLILLFAENLQWLPTARREGWEHFILPVFVLGWSTSAAQLRLMRSAMLEVLDSEYIKFARATGVSNAKVIYKHALRNSLIPPITLTFLLLANFLTGTIVVEHIFAWPGLGRLAIEAVTQTDFPLIAGIVLFATVAYVLANFLVDICYALIDPRIQFS